MYIDGKPQIPPFSNAVFHAGIMSGGPTQPYTKTFPRKVW